MEWITPVLSEHNIIVFLCIISVGIIASGLECGYPGSPASGRPIPQRESYRPGETVTFACNHHSQTLHGSFQRVCRTNGTWDGNIPICDSNLPWMDQHASSRATLISYTADKAIDGDRTTCTYTDKLKPRWVRVDLKKPYVVQAVSVTVPATMYKADDAHFTIHIISVRDSTTASYHKCADFKGKFTTPTAMLPCSSGGVVGRYIHIEDNRKAIDYFSICEIEVFIQKDSYECGEVDRPAHSYTTPLENGWVEYRCMYGYQLVGNSRRRCLPNGQWSGEQPLCQEILCPLLEEEPHGLVHYTGPRRDRPVQGTTANLTCDYGYRSNGQSRLCLESGVWSEESFSCEPVDCGPPPVLNDLEKYIMLNGTTTYGSVAMLFCSEDTVDETRNKKASAPIAVQRCREDGTWSSPTIDCSSRNAVSTLGLVETEDDNAVPNGVIIGMGVLVFLLFLLLLFIILFKRKQLMRRNSAESLPSKDTSSTSGQPTIDNLKSNLPFDNESFYDSITTDAKQPTRQQSPVERGILSTILFTKRKGVNADKGKNRKDSASSSSGTCFYEEIGLRSGSTQKLKKDEEASDIHSQPIYAQVDFEEKRRSRLAKSLTQQLDSSSNSHQGDKSDIPPDYDTVKDREILPDYDSEPVRVRELPPIPSDGDESSITYASLSRPPEPPPLPDFMRDNAIYMNASSPCPVNVKVMKDNSLYFSS